MASPIAYFEVGSRDNQALVTFYRELFGWQIDALGDGYDLVKTKAGTGLNGGIGRSGTGDPWVSFYVQVDDPQTVLDQAVARGGNVVMPVTEIPDILTFAMFDDPDGLLVGLVKTGTGAFIPDPSSEEAADGVPVDWFEVLGSDAARTQEFYSGLFGWTVSASGNPNYGMVDTSGWRGSIGGGLGRGEGSTWATVYARVPDVEAVLAKAEALGGSRVYGPNQVDDHMATGALRDPAGNVFGVYQHADG